MRKQTSCPRFILHHTPANTYDPLFLKRPAPNFFFSRKGPGIASVDGCEKGSDFWECAEMDFGRDDGVGENGEAEGGGVGRDEGRGRGAGS